MKKFTFFLLMAICFTACHESLEKRAMREAKEYTRKNCPITKYNVRTDSIAFDPNTRTLIFYHTMCNQLDDSALVASRKDEMMELLSDAFNMDISLKPYKEAGFNVRYEYHSNAHPEIIMIEKTFTSKDYAK